MKKPILLSAVFLFIFGVTFGIVVTLNDTAEAAYQCAFLCTFTQYCSTVTGPDCPCHGTGTAIYYVYHRSTCTGGPLNCPYVNEWTGCWTGNQPCIAQSCLDL